MTNKTKELEKCEHNVYVQNCDICRTKELEIVIYAEQKNLKILEL